MQSVVRLSLQTTEAVERQSSEQAERRVTVFARSRGYSIILAKIPTLVEKDKQPYQTYQFVRLCTEP